MQRSRTHLRRLGRLTAAMTVALTVALVTLPLAAEEATDWPQFRGHGRDGTSPETGLLRTWPEGGPKELWRRPLGPGYSEITAVDGRLYTAYAQGEGDAAREVVAAFDAGTGEELWRTALGPRLDTEFGNGPRSTPTVDRERVYALDSNGRFAALATADGRILWQLDLTETFGSSRPYWGYSTSAIVEDDLVLVETGGREGRCYAALDKLTGETRWTHGDAPAGHNSPLPVELAGERQLVFITSNKLVSMTAAGDELWSHQLEGNVETHAMPVFLPPDRFFASGTVGGAALVRVARDGDAYRVEELWREARMRNHFSSSVHHAGTVFGFDNATLKAISADSGELAWARRGFGKGSLILADAQLIVLSDKGSVHLAEASPEAWVEKGRVQALEGKCWTAPTLAAGRLYLRNHTEMVSYQVR